MCLKSINPYHTEPEVGVSWRSMFLCSSFAAVQGGLLGCRLWSVCCVHALPQFSAVWAGAE